MSLLLLAGLATSPFLFCPTESQVINFLHLEHSTYRNPEHDNLVAYGVHTLLADLITLQITLLIFSALLFPRWRLHACWSIPTHGKFHAEFNSIFSLAVMNVSRFKCNKLCLSLQISAINGFANIIVLCSKSMLFKRTLQIEKQPQLNKRGSAQKQDQEIF